MSKNNVRIAIRDSTDSHNVAFFDNKAGIKYKSANLQRFLAGSASILTIKYNSKDIDSIRSGCKLAFRYKNRDYWLNVMSFEKKGFEVELTAYSLGLELNNETRGEHKPSNAMSIAEYVGYYDPEHALTIGVNEVSDKRIKLEWTGTDTILARLFSVANSFGAELDFSVELNDDYSLKRQVLNIYKKGNLGTNKVSQPVRVGKELKVINYSDNIKELRTAVRATGKDGLTIDGLNKKIYDNNKELLYYSSGMTVYAPQSRDRFPSVGKGSNDNWIVEDLGETQYETKEALWGYLYSEIQKKSLPEITYEVEGAIEAGIGDTQTLIDDIHFEPPLYVQARVSELEDDILTGKVTKSTFINFERKYSQIADILLKQVEALAEDAAPYIVRLTTDNGYIFKNGQGTSTITAKLEKYSKYIAATWKWVVDNKVVGTGDKLTVKAEQVTNTMAVTVIAYVNGNEVVRDYMTFSNSDDGVGVASIDRYFTSSDQSDGVTIEGAEWSDKPPAPTEDGKYLWAYDEITYTDGTVTTTKPAAVGANFDVDAFRAEIAEDLKDVPNREEFENKIAEELANSKAEIETQIESAKTQAESNAKEYADTINQETAKVAELANAAAGEIKADLVNVKNNLTSTSLVANNAQAAVDAAKQELTEVASELNTAKQDLTNSIAEANTKVNSTKAELTQTKQDLANVASELNTAKQDLTDSVTAVNTKVDNTKAELTQTKQQLTNVANDLSQAKTDLQNAVSAVDTKAANLQSDLSKAKQDLTSQAQQLQEQANAQSELTKRVSTVEKTADGTKTTVSELSKTVAQNGKDITSVTNRTKTVEDDLAGTKTTLSQVKTTADSTSQKTATLETGLNGLNARFDSLSVGGTNLIKQSTAQNGFRLGTDGGRFQDSKHALSDWIKIEPSTVYTLTCYEDVDEPNMWYSMAFYSSNADDYSGGISRPTGAASATDLKNGRQYTSPANATYAKVSYPINYPKVKFERGNIATDYSPNDADLEQKVAEYKQNADQNYASLQTTVQNLDGTVQHNKTVADQTAQGFKTRIESLETYKNGESERANAYFESAKTETAKQLTAERTAIAKDYVAKSTYTSDVTGIRNELSATTSTANATKTNLANYQASNDKMVASLKSSLQTTDGNVSNLQTKVEAVPGQITSAVSAVEGKIPTNIGARNYIRNYGLTATGWTFNKADWKIEIISDSTAKSGQYLKATCTTASTSGGGFYKNLFDFSDGRLFGKQMTWAMDVKLSKAKTVKIGPEWGYAYLDINATTEWKRYSKTFTVATTSEFKQWIVYTNDNVWNVGDIVYIRDVQLEDGSIATTPVPAIEDTESDISNLSSQIKQTADGITLLATKTELNNAKSEMQSGITTATNKANAAQSAANNNAQTINTHTTQISALNTGLQAKVSQTDFNTLSGRVTTAENSITAKANELTSKIMSVEGKIPTNIGTVNLIVKSTAQKGFRLGTDGGRFQDSKHELTDWIKIEPSTVYTLTTYEDVSEPDMYYSLAWYSTNNSDYSGWISRPAGAGTAATLKGGKQYKSPANATYAKVSYPIKYSKVKLERGNISTDYNSNPDDYDDAITQVKSEIKQTADGITLLATKTELNSAKNDLQSGINTATNKANTAQSAANNNAQTISTHTTQISALNTGLQAKVSQSDFNTLSGRVTTAENNITAKANELSSKITAVEGKIPTTVGGRNYALKTGDSKSTSTAGDKLYDLSSGFDGIADNATLIIEFDWSVTAPTSTSKFRINRVIKYSDGTAEQWDNMIQLNAGDVATAGRSGHYSGTFKKIKYNSKAVSSRYLHLNQSTASGTVTISNLSVRVGSLKSDWSPAPEDTVNQISSLSSELKQTADGMTLLATKTELNSAKNDLQSGVTTATNKANSAQSTANSAQNKANSNAQTISTHTTQISALNTGLQAKVSQSEFNTLSGRVTTAENNITAKANELSSKITSVEGKIPTSSGGRNLAQGTSKDWSNPFTGFSGIQDTGVRLYKVITDGLVVGDTIKTRIVLKYTNIRPASGKTAEIWVQGAGNVTAWNSGAYPSGGGGRRSLSGSGEIVFELTDKINADHLKNDYWNMTFRTDWIASGSLQWKLAKVERGMFFTDWSPAPEDTISQINAVSSELKQTADGMTMLATKTELNTAKSDLQSGITTATNKANTAQSTADSAVTKANAAQSKANSNAQTISTHTTQISALNTGLSAKVSQSEFNTLSGRVTTAENNITAKANELSSKITSVEGAIEDTQSDITKLSSEIKQTADGMTMLATKTELNTAKSDLQSGITTATNKANTAQNTADSAVTKANAAQSAANSNAQVISTHTTQISALNTGLSAKVSQSDFNTLSGRVTTAENNITAKANELSSKITTVEGKIPTEIGAKNLIIKSTAKIGFRLSSDGKQYQDQSHSLSDWIKIEPNTTYTLTTYENVNEANMWYSMAWYSTNNADYGGFISRPVGAVTADYLKGGKQYQAPANAKYAKVSYPTKYAKFKLERGKISTDYTPAPEDYDSKLATAQSELKQTTDAIKASVSSLDKSTVKSSSLTINADGIVMKAGKSTTDVANAIGSYFAVNQNAINLFSDKINVKGNMIVNGAITSDKIASKSINTAHLNGKIITADVISSDAVTASAIKAGAVTTDKMSANSINGDRITAGTLDAAKIKAGSITASQIASGTITSNQIKAGGISSANIAAGAITGDKIAAGAIDANKIAANAITANMIKGGQLKSTNGATSFDLNAGTLTFNNDYGYIQRVSSDKVFEITTVLGKDANSQDFLTSEFTIRKSDFSRQAGAKFTLYNATTNKPTARATIHADELVLFDSQNTTLLSILAKGSLSNFNFQDWGDIPVAQLPSCGLMVKDIGIGGYTKSLQKIVEELCRKTGVLWI